MHIRTTAVTALVFGCSILALFSMSSVAQPGTLTVGEGGQYSGIQAAVNAASPGDTIIVYSGTYRENVVVDKQLNLAGEDTGRGKPVVDADRAGSAILLSGGNINVFGFALTGSSYDNAGIKVVSDNNLIKDCDLYNNYDGILLFRSSGNIIISNHAYSNSYDGINLNQSGDNHILNNMVTGNDHDGIRIERYSHRNLIEGNDIDDNALSSVESESKNAITIFMSDGNVVQGNTLENNGGTVVRESGTYRLGDGVMAMETKDTVVRNNTMNNDHYAVWIYRSTNATVTGNTATKHYYCIVAEDSSGVTVSDNVLSKGGRNARIISSSYVTFRNNTLFDGIFDMSVDDSNHCTIDGNRFYDCRYDTLMVSNSGFNLIANNSIDNTYGFCLRLESSNNNDIYLNDFLSDKGTVASADSVNRWETPTAMAYRYGSSIFTGYLGNNWGNYYGLDPDGDGVGEDKYVIDSQNIDHYPMVKAGDNYLMPPPVVISVTPSPTAVNNSSQPPEDTGLWAFIIHIFNMLCNL